jgi:hypothetical protein
MREWGNTPYVRSDTVGLIRSGIPGAMVTEIAIVSRSCVVSIALGLAENSRLSL